MQNDDLDKDTANQLKMALLAVSGLSSKKQAALQKEFLNDGDFGKFVDQVDVEIVHQFVELHEIGHGDLNYDNLLIECKHTNEVHFIKAPHHGQTRSDTAGERINRFLCILELASRILPRKAQKHIFQPSFNDAKKQFLQDRRKYNSNTAHKWLNFCFAVHITLILCQCFWSIFSGKIGRLILRFAPEFFRKLL